MSHIMRPRALDLSHLIPAQQPQYCLSPHKPSINQGDTRSCLTPPFLPLRAPQPNRADKRILHGITACPPPPPTHRPRQNRCSLVWCHPHRPQDWLTTRLCRQQGPAQMFRTSYQLLYFITHQYVFSEISKFQWMLNQSQWAFNQSFQCFQCAVGTIFWKALFFCSAIN